MFKKNLDALKVKNSSLAALLEGISFDDIKDDFEVYQAESQDVIISYQGLALDDIYDPIRVAKTNWNMNVPSPLKKYDIVVVFGFGLGYLFKRAFVSTDARILMYEPKLEILRYVLEYVDFSNEITDNRVFFTATKSDALNFLTEKYLSDDNLIFLYPEAYAQLVTQEMVEFTNDVVEVCNLKKMDVNTIKILAKQWAQHSLVNLTNMKYARPICWFKNSLKGKTALITAAGPSLADNIENIKKHRDKFVIFSVNRAAKTLYDNGIEPDFVLFSDVVSINHTIDNIEDKLAKTNIIADLRANNLVYKTFPNVITYFSKNDLIAQYLSNVTNNSFELTETAGTAAAQAYYCAKLLGINEIIFAGLDLAFKGDIIYSDGQKAIIDENNQVPVGNSKTRKKNIVTVKDLNGNLINSRDDYALFVRQFEDIFAQDLLSDIYNVSGFGAYIEGMIYKPLEDIIKNKNTADMPIDANIKKIKDDNAEKWAEIWTQFCDILAEEKNILFGIKQKTTLLLDKELSLLQKISSNDSANSQIENEINLLNDEFSALLPEIVSDAFLSQYFQSEFVQFVNIKNQGLSHSSQAFVDLKNFEVKLLEGILEISEIWVKFLEETLG